MEVDVKLFVPVGARLSAKTMNGSIHAKDVEGVLNFHSANGDIEVKGGPREARLARIRTGPQRIALVIHGTSSSSTTVQ